MTVGSGRAGKAADGPKGDTPLLAGADLVEGYVAALHAERGLSPYTVRNYRSDLYDLLEWLQRRGVGPLAINRGIFREYLGDLADRRSARASVTRRVSTAHSFYRHLVREGALHRDPLEGVYTFQACTVSPRPHDLPCSECSSRPISGYRRIVASIARVTSSSFGSFGSCRMK